MLGVLVHLEPAVVELEAGRARGERHGREGRARREPFPFVRAAPAAHWGRDRDGIFANVQPAERVAAVERAGERPRSRESRGRGAGGSLSFSPPRGKVGARVRAPLRLIVHQPPENIDMISPTPPLCTGSSSGRRRPATPSVAVHRRPAGTAASRRGAARPPAAARRPARPPSRVRQVTGGPPLRRRGRRVARAPRRVAPRLRRRPRLRLQGGFRLRDGPDPGRRRGRHEPPRRAAGCTPSVSTSIRASAECAPPPGVPTGPARAAARRRARSAPSIARRGALVAHLLPRGVHEVARVEPSVELRERLPERRRVRSRARAQTARGAFPASGASTRRRSAFPAGRVFRLGASFSSATAMSSSSYTSSVAAGARAS